MEKIKQGLCNQCNRYHLFDVLLVTTNPDLSVKIKILILIVETVYYYIFYFINNNKVPVYQYEQIFFSNNE